MVASIVRLVINIVDVIKDGEMRFDDALGCDPTHVVLLLLEGVQPLHQLRAAVVHRARLVVDAAERRHGTGVGAAARDRVDAHSGPIQCTIADGKVCTHLQVVVKAVGRLGRLELVLFAAAGAADCPVGRLMILIVGIGRHFSVGVEYFAQLLVLLNRLPVDVRERGADLRSAPQDLWRVHLGPKAVQGAVGRVVAVLQTAHARHLRQAFWTRQRGQAVHVLPVQGVDLAQVWVG